jgi:hypothetical protein
MVAISLSQKVRLQYFFDQSDYSVAPGGTVAVTVFLRETFNPSIGSSLLAPGTDGLVSAGFMIQCRSTPPSRPALVLATSAIAGNPGFDFATIPQLPVPTFEHTAGIVALSSNPVYGEIGSRTPSRETVLLTLATFTFTGGPAPGDVTHLTALNAETNLRLASDTVVTASGLVLDSLLEPGRATITVRTEASHTPAVGDESCFNGAAGDSSRTRRSRNP